MFDDDDDEENEYITGLDGWFQGDVAPVADGMVCVAGTYCIYTLRLDGEQEKMLSAIIGRLPGRNSSTGQPANVFFGADESTPPFLCTSWEPSGIQVSGTLGLSDWNAWDEAFRQLVDEAELPRFPA